MWRARASNYGPEQERLNNVFGAHLRITALRARSGPGIEFLEYLAPQDGRPYPADARANDLFHWQTRIVDSSARSDRAKLRNAPCPMDFVRDRELSRCKARTASRSLFRDPDGHAVQIAEVTH